VAVTGESLRPLPIDFSASWNGTIDDGCATLRSGSFLTGARAFLKLGNLAFGFGAEKNEESERTSLTARTGFVSFFMAVGFDAEVVGATAAFLAGGGGFADVGRNSVNKYGNVVLHMLTSTRKMSEDRSQPNVSPQHEKLRRTCYNAP
jgi:hypothetical protein